MKKYTLVLLAFILVVSSMTFQSSLVLANEELEDEITTEESGEEESSDNDSEENEELEQDELEKETNKEDLEVNEEESEKQKDEKANSDVSEEENVENETFNTTANKYDVGDKGSHVKELKLNLTKLGFGNFPNNPSETYGNVTANVVKEFQEYYSLNTSGKADNETLNKIEEILSSAYSIGKSGKHVRELKQDLTKLSFGNFPKNPSTTYGSVTSNVVKDFQKHYNLPQSGIAEQNTLDKIENVKSVPYRTGDRGVAIVELKKDLTKLGYGNFPKNPSITYGNVTANVVKDFQKINGLSQSGEANQETLNKIDELLNSSYTIGQSGKHVRELKQDLTKIGFGNFPKNPSTTYGTVTSSVVKDFQKHYKLPQSGIADQRTLDKIASVLSLPYTNGDRGIAIATLKKNLSELGYGNFPKNPSITYGSVTANVVKDFQKSNGLKQSGEADKQTLDKIDELLESSYRIGEKGQHVRKLKEDLTQLGFGNFPYKPSNSYGKVTADVVKDFQKHYKLPQSGIADKVTLDKIKSVLNPPYQQGDRGLAIVSLKNNLSKIGYGNFPKNPSISYGKVTADVVKEFQKEAGLKVDGIADAETLTELENPFRNGSKGKHIVKLKKDLTKLGYGNFPTNPSKSYGNVTANVVKEFQKEQNLNVTGIVDDVTLAKITQLIHNQNVKPVTKTEYTNYNLTLNQALDIQMDRPTIITDKYSNDPAYVSANYLRFTGAAKVVGNNVNVRTAPDTSKNNVAFKLAGGSPITITGTKNGTKLSGSSMWYQITQKGKKYYIHSQHATGAKAIATSNVNVRAGKGNSHHIYGQLKKGDNVNLIAQGPSWHEIEYKAWRNPTRSDMRAYLDPSKNDKFQHLRLDSTVGVSAGELNKVLAGKGVLAGQGQAFINGAKKHGINEAYLMSHAFLETGHGTSTLATGVEVGKDKSGKLVRVTSSNRKNLTAIKTTYNMFGIGAVDSNPLNGGAITAYENGWTTPAKAIEGGAKWIGDGYIYNEHGQNTLYKMKWNPNMVDGAAWKQYATDIAWATKQVSNIKNIYTQLNNPSHHFDIARYN